jgi:hypothetical protein
MCGGGGSADVTKTRLIDSVREAPAAARGARPTTTWREDLNAMIIAFWPITALFFDGRNHNNKTGQESFFTTAHIVLYTGMTVFAIYVAVLINRYQLKAGANPSRGSSRAACWCHPPASARCGPNVTSRPRCAASCQPY